MTAAAAADWSSTVLVVAFVAAVVAIYGIREWSRVRRGAGLSPSERALEDERGR